MFHIPTDTGGDKGPFFQYKQRAGQGMADGSWYLREKDGDDWHYTDMTNAFKGGIVADVFATHDGELGGTLKMGFIKFTEGKAPDRFWWKSPLHAEQRPDEGKNSDGAFEWQNAVSFRVAIGGGKSASFDVTGWGGYKGVMGLLEQMNKGFAANVGNCPLVQYTGFRTEGSGKTRLHVPEFTIAKWVPRPECLKPEAPEIGAAASPAPTEQPATTQQAPVPADAEW